MRIAFIVNNFPSLSETFVLNQITGLIDLGHEVDVYADSAKNQSKIHLDVEKYNILERTYYWNIPSNKYWRVAKAVGLMIKNFHRNPRAILSSINIFKFGKKVLSFRILYGVITLLNKSPYDIIQCHFGLNGVLGVMLRDTGVIQGKVVTTFHGIDISLEPKIFGKDIYNYLFRQGDLFVPISERWKQKLIELGCDENRIRVHKVGININLFTQKEYSYRSEERIELLTIARLVDKKGVEYGIRAVAAVAESYPNLHYGIVGDGELKDFLNDLIIQLNLSDKIKLLGWKNQEEILDLMQRSSIIIAPSVTSQHGDQEGIPVVLMEALAMGIPVISTWHSGIPELVQDGKSGFLAPEKDVEALREKLEYLIKHPEIWVEMGSYGHDFVKTHHDVYKLNQKLLSIYYQLINTSQSVQL